MNTNKILIALLFLIAVVLLATALFYPKLIDIEDRADLESVVDEETQDPTPTSVETTVWKTSRNHFTIEVSSGLTISQRDAGDVSLIEILRREDSDLSKRLAIELGLSSTLEGTPISLDTWMNEQLLDADKIEECDATSFGGESAQCFLVTTHGEVQKEYYGVADALSYFKVIIAPVPTVEIARAFSTLNFNPTPELLESAKLIP